MLLNTLPIQVTIFIIKLIDFVCVVITQVWRFTEYPLAVKLGTITKDGKADVYSYDEDDMVEDPNLEKHLAHFGINIFNMVKVSVFE